jgi:hypothetical protein
LLTDQRTLCIVGVGSAALAVAADLALQYTGNATHVGSHEYAYLLDVSRDRLLFGHFAGVFAVLLEIIGFWGVALGFTGPKLRFAFFATCAVAFAVGAAFHAMFAVIGLSLQFAADANAAPGFLTGLAAAVRPAHEALGSVTIIGILILSVILILAIARGRTAYPRWMAALSPLPVVVGLAIAMRAFPSLRLVLLPAGLNFANLVLFSAAAILARPVTALRAAV